MAKQSVLDLADDKLEEYAKAQLEKIGESSPIIHKFVTKLLENGCKPTLFLSCLIQIQEEVGEKQNQEME